MSDQSPNSPNNALAIPMQIQQRPHENIDIDAIRGPVTDPRHIGNCICLFYKDHFPRITIGPQCIF